MKKLIPYIVAVAIGFGAGMLAYYDGSYKIKDDEGKHYLCEKAEGKCEQITNDFQLGSLEYRIDGIKKQMVENERLFK
jgi:hypothetical protein